MAEIRIEAPPPAGLPFGVWWAVVEACAVAIALPLLRLLGAM